MTVQSIGQAVAAASNLFRFGFRPPVSESGPMSLAAGDESEDVSDEAADPEQESLFRAVEVALREAGYLDA